MVFANIERNEESEQFREVSMEVGDIQPAPSGGRC